MRAAGVLLLLVVLYFPFFLHLDVLPLRIWDEARLAINAQEMAATGELLRTTAEGKADHWNTKPPFLIWFQALSYHLLPSHPTLAIRLPVAIFGMITCLALFVMLRRINLLLAFIAPVVLAATEGYVSIHGTRTGDYDAVVTFFTTIALFSFFFAIHHEERRGKWFTVFFLSLALGCLTKGVVPLLFTPFLLLYIILTRRHAVLLYVRSYLPGLLLFLFLVPGYYLLREANDPGYLQAVWDNELGGRYASTIEYHRHPFQFYFDQILNSKYTSWLPFFLFSVVLLLVQKEKSQARALASYCLLNAVGFILVISWSDTKLLWYDLPLYPLMAVVTAWGVYVTSVALRTVPVRTEKSRPVIAGIFVFLFLLFPYRPVINGVYKPTEKHWDQDFYKISYFLKEQAESTSNRICNYNIGFQGYNYHLLFYTRILNSKGCNVKFIDWRNPPSGLLVVQQVEVKEYLKRMYDLKVEKVDGPLEFYNIIRKK